MARKGKPLAEELLNVFVTWPWYVSLALAAVIFFGIDIYQQLTPDAATFKAVAQTPGDVVRAAFEPAKMIALSIVKYLLPALLITASLVALIKSLLNIKRYKTVADAPSSESLNNMSWRDFESLVGEFFRRKGYRVKETPRGPDGGVDLRITKDHNLYLVQCKQWLNRKVPVAVVRELYGIVMAERAAGGFIVASGGLTREATEFASGKPIYLIDGKTFHGFVRERETRT